MRRTQIDRWVQRFIAAYEIAGWRPMISRFQYTLYRRQRTITCGCAIGAYVAAFDSTPRAHSYSTWIPRFARLTGLSRATANGIMHGFDWDPEDDPFDFTGGLSEAYRDGVLIGQHVRAAMAREEIH